MSATLVELLVAARHAGLHVDAEHGTVNITGPRTAEPLARALLARKPDVLRVVDYLAGRAAVLGWADSVLLIRPEPCVLCGRPASLREPYDQRPCHKGCVETALRPAANHRVKETA